MLEETWRWFGPNDPISLNFIKMTGITKIVTALHDVPIGEVWEYSKILEIKNLLERYGFIWHVVESIPIHESIKYGGYEREKYIQNYITSVQNVSKAGINIICYNFMPVVDWTRTNLKLIKEDDSETLSFEFIDYVIFDRFILKNKKTSYSEEIVKKASVKFFKMNQQDMDLLTKNILKGLPGSNVESYTLENFQKCLDNYKYKTVCDIKNNLKYFLDKVIPTAELCNCYLGIHPDDPPISLFGIPRVVSNISDLKEICDHYPSKCNGITLCVGSLSSSKDNNIREITESLLDKINFVHLRNVVKKDDYSFEESGHINGDINMVNIIKLLSKIKKCVPFRPDHGQLLADDLKKDSINPGYSYIGRLKGISELRGILSAVNEYETDITYNSVIEKLEKCSTKIIPIVKNNIKISDKIDKYPFLEYVCRGNIEESKYSIRYYADCNVNMIIGTVITKEEVDYCHKHNLRIYCSPHFDDKLILYCQSKNCIMIPGVTTPSEIMSGYKLGVRLFKFFPTNSGDNIRRLKQYSEIYDKLGIKFIASGGIDLSNSDEILSIKNVITVATSKIL